MINIQLKNISSLLNNITDDIKKNMEKLKNLLNENKPNVINNEIQIKVFSLIKLIIIKFNNFSFK